MDLSDTLIVIAGMSRGGTNLLWNIVQSHPDVIDSYYELNEILARKTGIGWLEKLGVEIEALSGMHVPGLCGLVENRLERFSKKSFQEDQFNREKRPGVTYDEGDFDSLIVCTKLVSAWEVDPLRKLLKRNDALKYIPILKRTFPEVKIVFLVRNGLAIAEGWGRRGADIQTAARWYAQYINSYEKHVEKYPGDSMIVRFEDLLNDPFESATQLFHRLSLSNDPLDHLRIAIKPTIRSNHDIVNATRKNKIWIDRENWRNYLDISINEAQIERISVEDRRKFVSANLEIMERYGYL